MDFLVQSAWAAAPAGQPSFIATILPFVILIAVFYFLLIRPQTKRAKEHREMVSALKANDEVVTGGGILGRIKKVGDAWLTLEVADGVELKVRKDSVSALMPKETYKNAD